MPRLTKYETLELSLWYTDKPTTFVLTAMGDKRYKVHVDYDMNVVWDKPPVVEGYSREELDKFVITALMEKLFNGRGR